MFTSKKQKNQKAVGLFDFLKPKTTTNLTIEQTIRALIDDLPEYYKSHQKFKKCNEFLDQYQWGLALDSLIELAYDSGHFFSDNFWSELSDIAEKMKMSNQASFCREQIKATKMIISWTINKGSTVNKIDDNHYTHYYSQKTYDRWNSERRVKDNLQSFINKNGFHIQKGGRDGTIYYISSGKVCEIYWEMSGVPQFDILISIDQVDSWALPTKQLLTENERAQIKQELLVWLQAQKIRADIDPNGSDQQKNEVTGL